MRGTLSSSTAEVQRVCLPVDQQWASRSPSCRLTKRATVQKYMSVVRHLRNEKIDILSYNTSQLNRAVYIKIISLLVALCIVA
jgi:hypothetical protein